MSVSAPQLNPATQTPLILSLEKAHADDISLIGGKAAGLALLIQSGANVPSGFCLTTEAYREHVADLDPQDIAEMRAAIRDRPLSNELKATIATAYELWGHNVRVAVRSSATDEDHANHSYAGQYVSCLNVSGITDIFEAIKTCWLSLWNERACDYRTQQGIDSNHVAMAVILQKQIDAQSAGVLMTLNPVQGSDNEAVIEAHWGLGQAVVSGDNSPDRYDVNPWQLKIVNKQIAKKRGMFRLAEHGMERVRVPREQQKQSVLSDEQILQLTQQATVTQAVYGEPLELEWCWDGKQFFLLQIRRLTAFSFTTKFGLWTSANFREILPGFISPFSFSLFQQEFNQAITDFFIRSRSVCGDPTLVEWSRTFFGHAYWNVQQIKEVSYQTLPAFHERIFDESVGCDPTYAGTGRHQKATALRLLRSLPFFITLNNLYRREWKTILQFINEQHPQKLQQIATQQTTQLNDSDLQQALIEAVALRTQTSQLTLFTGLLAKRAQDDLRIITEYLNRKLSQEHKLETRKLLAKQYNESTPHLKSLKQLANSIRENPELNKLFNESSPLELQDKLATSTDGIWEKIRVYQQEFSYLAQYEEELAEPRWDEDPKVMLALLQAFTKDTAGQTQINQHTEANELIDSAPLRHFWKSLLKRQVSIAHRYQELREQLRIPLAKTNYQLRALIKEQGRRWHQTGHLEQAKDIFLLEWKKIELALKQSEQLTELTKHVSGYKLFKQAYRHFVPPKMIGSEQLHQVDSEPLGNGLQGVACSSGMVSGRVRVIKDINDAGKIEPGDILVTTHTNLAWGPLFHLIGGLITEKGGVLSHTAILARELNLPTIVQVKEATKLLRDGTEVRLDAYRGYIEISL